MIAPMPDSRLRQERERRKLTVAHVAKEVGTAPSNLSRIELGQVPTKQVARALFSFYRGQVSLGDVYDPMYRTEVGSVHPGKVADSA